MSDQSTMRDHIEDLMSERQGFLDEIERLRADRDKWQAIANRLGTHMGEALYGDEEWSCREYAISAYAEWERTDGAHLTKYQVEPQPRWYFKGGKEV